MKPKSIVLAIAGAEDKPEIKDVDILPDTRVSDVLTKLNLQGFDLLKPEGGVFAREDDLYGSVSAGQKLYLEKSAVQAGR